MILIGNQFNEQMRMLCAMNAEIQNNVGKLKRDDAARDCCGNGDYTLIQTELL